MYLIKSRLKLILIFIYTTVRLNIYKTTEPPYFITSLQDVLIHGVTFISTDIKSLTGLSHRDILIHGVTFISTDIKSLTGLSHRDNILGVPGM